MKPKVGFYDLTGCQGCLLSVIFNEDDILDIIGAVDIKEFRFIMGEKYDGELDLCFIEGSVVTKDDLEVVKKLRERSKVVIALGTCANEGCVQSLRQTIPKEAYSELEYEKREQNRDNPEGPVPITKVIDVEYKLPGCPPDRDEIKKFIKEILLGKTFRNCNSPVCVECKLNKNGCLLDEGEICVGPITAGGCKAVCTTNGLKCYGCRGLTDDANLDEFYDLMQEKGINIEEAKKIMQTFMAHSINEKIKDTKWEK